jgi:hypothetical protein
VRVLGVRRRGWLFIAAAVALAGASAVLARLWLPAAFVSGVGACVAVVTAVWVARGTSMLDTGDEEWDVLGRQLPVARKRALPLVRDLVDPVAIGVHPAAALGTSMRDRCPPFVSREFTAHLGDVLRQEFFVLLVGESTAGKSRAAYELMRAELPDFRVVQPSGRDSVLTAAGVAARTPRTVLWLDDLERFLGSSGLTGVAVQEVLGAGDPRYIVATMRSEEYAKFSGRSVSGLEGIGRDALRQGWDVLRLAARVEVPRMWSHSEIDRARRMHEDPRLAEAVRHCSEYGIAEYLAAAPQLLADWRDAWAPGMHPRAAAIVQAAVDARRAGVHRPLSLATLADLHEPYLQRRGGQRLRPETIEAAMAWATTPLYATSSLLMPIGEGFLAFDYLIDGIDKDRSPAAALDAIIRIATPGEALDIGQLAWGWGLIDQAESAFRRAEAEGLFEATERRCYLIGEDRGGRVAALRFAKQASERVTALRGPNSPEALDARSLVAWQTGHAGDCLTARHLLEGLAAQCARQLGPDHEQTIRMRMGIAAMTGESGEHAAAAAQYEELAEDCRRILGEDHKLTLSCRDQAAAWTNESGEPVQAADMYCSLLAAMTQRLRSRGEDVFHTRCMVAYCRTQAGDHDPALRQWDQLISEAAATYGHLHSSVFYVRVQHAWCSGESGSPQRAVQLLQQTLADANELGDPELFIVLDVRRSLAWWIGEMGNPVEAAKQLCALHAQASAQRGEDDPRVKTVRHMLNLWTAVNGSQEAALDAVQRCVNQMVRELGPAHEITRASQRQLKLLATKLESLT